MSRQLEQACAGAIQVDRQIVADLNVVLHWLRTDTPLELVEELLVVVIRRAANSTMAAHAAIWQALHPEEPDVVPPLLALTDAPGSAQVGVVRTSSTDCRSAEGVTVGLIDGLISILRVLAQRDLTPAAVREALLDLTSDADLQQVLGCAQERAAGVCAQTCGA